MLRIKTPVAAAKSRAVAPARRYRTPPDRDARPDCIRCPGRAGSARGQPQPTAQCLEGTPDEQPALRAARPWASRSIRPARRPTTRCRHIFHGISLPRIHHPATPSLDDMIGAHLPVNDLPSILGCERPARNLLSVGIRHSPRACLTTAPWELRPSGVFELRVSIPVAAGPAAVNLLGALEDA